MKQVDSRHVKAKWVGVRKCLAALLLLRFTVCSVLEVAYILVPCTAFSVQFGRRQHLQNAFCFTPFLGFTCGNITLKNRRIFSVFQPNSEFVFPSFYSKVFSF